MVAISTYIPYLKIVDLLDLNKGDIILIGSDITQLAIQALRNREKLDPNRFIDSIIDKIGPDGTLLFPTFNWDFCRGIPFDFRKSDSKTGILTNVALKRSDFHRTAHPIYSFAVWGKNRDYLVNMKNTSSFGADSPFAYLHHNHATMITIGLPYQTSFTFVHYVEEMNQVSYRYMKSFQGQYIDEYGQSTEREYTMYVRDLERGVETKIQPIGDDLEQANISIRKKINEVDFYRIDLAQAYDLISQDIQINGAKKLFIFNK